GPKTATDLIRRYGTVENVIAHASELKGALAKKVEANAEMARLSRKLVTIDTDVEIDAGEESLVPRGVNEAGARALFTELEFTRLVSELAPSGSLSREGYRTVDSAEKLKEVVSCIRRSRVMCIDLETTSLDPMQAEIVGFALSWKQGEAAYIPVGHVATDLSGGDGQTGELFGGRPVSGQLPCADAASAVSELLNDESILKVGQNLNYDFTILRRMGFEINGPAFDTMLASYVLNPSEAHGLDAMAQKHLGHKTITYDDVTGRGKSRKNFAEVPVKVASDYACEDADVTLRLKELFAPRIEEEGLSDLFYEMEMRLLPVLVDMQIAGMKVDSAKLAALEEDFSRRLSKLERRIFKEAGEEFNVNSPKQLGEILFGKMKLPGDKKTKTGFSTGQEILEELAGSHALPGLVLEYRSLSKLKGTYVDALPALIDKKSGRIHTSFNQAVAATGRLSSSDPNLQNIPVRSEEGKKIREAFVAEDGFVLISADYSQIELRVLAHMSEDPALLGAFEKGDDVHAMTASGIFGVPTGKITEEQRSVGKTVNFATIYGQTAFGLSKQLGIDVGEAAGYIENYFKKYPGVAAYREEVLARARREGRVDTLFGRRRFMPDMESANAMMRQMAERTAFNTVFQGTAADIIKLAMISIHDGLPRVSAEARVVLQVHDELIVEAPDGDAAAVKEYVASEMGGAAKLRVPLVVDVCEAKNWAEAH
nr:DNA polymerase I [bacterium]